MATLKQRIEALERKAKHAAHRDDRPWDVQFAESLEEMKIEVDEILKPYGGDSAAYFDHAAKVNTAATLKKS